MTGGFDLTGTVHGEGEGEKPVQFLRGSMELTARKGRIYRFNLLSKIFSFVNVTGIVRGSLPDFRDKGFAYDSIKVRADLEDGKILIREGSLQGLTMQIASMGEIDHFGKKIDMKVLVAPLILGCFVAFIATSNRGQKRGKKWQHLLHECGMLTLIDGF